MKRIPPIKSVMTAFPYSVAIDASLEEAEAMLAEHDIRHLPVKQNGDLVGVIAGRDIAWLRARAPRAAGASGLCVRDAYVREAYVVEMDEPLDNVLVHLATHHIGSALVVKEGRLAGIFTATDACREFAQHLRDQFRPQGGDDAA